MLCAEKEKAVALTSEFQARCEQRAADYQTAVEGKADLAETIKRLLANTPEAVRAEIQEARKQRDKSRELLIESQTQLDEVLGDNKHLTRKSKERERDGNGRNDSANRRPSGCRHVGGTTGAGLRLAHGCY